jgi:uncharacterized membrane protein HdeD (DUF308 family)
MKTNELPVAARGAVRAVSRSWWVLLIQGIAAIILGILLLINPATTLIALAWVLGIYWIVGGVMDIVGAFTRKDGDRGWFWSLVSGGLGIIVGLMLVSQPIMGAVLVPFTLTLMIGIGAILIGISNIIGGFVMRKEIEGEWWMIIWGVLSIVLGVWMLAHLGASTIGFVYAAAIFAIIAGIAMIFFSFRLRGLQKRVQALKAQALEQNI